MPSPDFNKQKEILESTISDYVGLNPTATIGDIDELVENLYTNSTSNEDRQVALETLISIAMDKNIEAGITLSEVPDASSEMVDLTSDGVKLEIMSQLATDPSVALKSPLYAAILAASLGTLSTEDEVVMDEDKKNELNDNFANLTPAQQMELSTNVVGLSPEEERKVLEQEIFDNPDLINDSALHSMIARDSLQNNQNATMIQIVQNESEKGLVGNTFEKLLNSINIFDNSHTHEPKTPYDEMKDPSSSSKDPYS